jgi:dephospho-CoA kinase
MRREIPVIGIVGGIGAGKSTVAAELAALGCLVIDGDAIGHELRESAGVKKTLRAEWGDGIFDASGSVSRRALAEKVFSDPAALARLNRILAPRFRRRIRRRIEQGRADPNVPAIVLDAAVLLEARWDGLCTHCLFVRASDRRRQARAATRGWTARQWKARENSQISLDIKAARCDYMVDNSSSIPRVREQIRRIFREITKASDRR